LFRVEISTVSSLPDLIVSGLIIIIFDIVLYGFIEEHWLLTYNSEARSQIMDIVVFYLLAVNCYLTGIVPVKSKQQLHDR
jgi:hypothetical protein